MKVLSLVFRCFIVKNAYEVRSLDDTVPLKSCYQQLATRSMYLHISAVEIRTQSLRPKILAKNLENHEESTTIGKRNERDRDQSIRNS